MAVEAGQCSRFTSYNLIANLIVSWRVLFVKRLLSASKHIKWNILFEVKSSGILDVQISFPMGTNGINVNRCGQSRKFDFESRRDSGKLTNGNSFALLFASWNRCVHTGNNVADVALQFKLTELIKLFQNCNT